MDPANPWLSEAAQQRKWAANWQFPAGTVYMNHGSFGPPPIVVRHERRKWIDRLDDQPMRFYVRELEPALLAARDRLSSFVGTAPGNLVFVENATYGMNVVANSVPLEAGDEVVLTDHEYGAVRRIWQRCCDHQGRRVVDAHLSLPLESHEQVIDAIFSRVSSRTRLIVVSHVTSATAIVMPIREICRRAREQGILVCVDGPHAIAQLDFRLDELECDFYTASCHKWLCAPLGSGFLYVNPQRHSWIKPTLQSWGRLLPAIPEKWDEEFWWSGTRDPSGYLTVPTAIDFIESFGAGQFRQVTHATARQVRQRLETLTGETAIVPDDPSYYGSMTEVPLPSGDWSGLQRWLWSEHGIEVPIIYFFDRWFIRVSCHLYTLPEHIGQLLEALQFALEHPDRITKEVPTALKHDS